MLSGAIEAGTCGDSEKEVTSSGSILKIPSIERMCG